MTATDKLRRMLDERGVEWEDYSDEKRKHTDWNNLTCWFTEYPDGWTQWGMTKRGTPEQAIAATLGQEDTYTREECEASFVRGYSLGSLPVGSDPRWDENRQTVDEHMAELGWVRVATLGDAEHTTALMDEFVRVLDERDTLNAKFEVSQSMRHSEYEQYTKENAKLRAQLAEWKRVAESKQDIIDHMRDANAENDKLRELVRVMAYCVQGDRECDGCRLNGADGTIMASVGCDGLLDRLRELGIEVDRG